MDKLKVERVSSHVYSTMDIAFRFLPDNTNENQYDKLKILKMLHFHDSAEAFISDLVKGEKEAEDVKEERKWISIMSAMGMINEFSELLEVKDLYIEFEKFEHC